MNRRREDERWGEVKVWFSCCGQNHFTIYRLPPPPTHSIHLFFSLYVGGCCCSLSVPINSHPSLVSPLSLPLSLSSSLPVGYNTEGVGWLGKYPGKLIRNYCLIAILQPQKQEPNVFQRSVMRFVS